MARVTITVPDALVQRFLDAFAWKFNFNQAIDGTKLAFFKKQVSAFLEEIAIDYEQTTAATSASDAQRITSESQLRGAITIQ